MADRKDGVASPVPRVALLTGGFDIGGTTTFTLYLAEGLKKLGVAVEVFGYETSHPMRQEFERAGVRVHLPHERARIFEDRIAGTYRALREFAPTVAFAVLGGVSFEMLRYLPPGVLRVGMIHDHFQPIYDLLQTYRRQMDLIAAVSDKTFRHTAQLLPEIPCEYLMHGILLPEDRPMRVPHPGEPLRLLFFGRFDEAQKQVSMFPKVYRELIARDVPFTWTFHGHGKGEAMLKEALADGVAAGRVRFSQPVDHAQLGAIIAGHDVYMLASTHEAGPLTLLEAMSQGLVPVCGDIPCLVDEVIKTGENGFRVPVMEPRGYADKVQALHEDRALLERLSQAAIRTITETYSLTAMAQRYLDFLARAPQASGEISWPATIRPQAPLTAAKPLQFHPLLRPLRRVLKSSSRKA